MKHKYLILFFLLITLTALLNGCSSEHMNKLSSQNTTPDDRNPLSIPPDFDLPSPKEETQLKATQANVKVPQDTHEQNINQTTLTKADKTFMEKLDLKKKKHSAHGKIKKASYTHKLKGNINSNKTKQSANTAQTILQKKLRIKKQSTTTLDRKSHLNNCDILANTTKCKIQESLKDPTAKAVEPYNTMKQINKRK